MHTTNHIILRVLADDPEKLPAGIINVSAIKKIFQIRPRPLRYEEKVPLAAVSQATASPY